jgi:hypothetical protein
VAGAQGERDGPEQDERQRKIGTQAPQSAPFPRSQHDALPVVADLGGPVPASAFIESN